MPKKKSKAWREAKARRNEYRRENEARQAGYQRIREGQNASKRAAVALGILGNVFSLIGGCRHGG